MSQRHNPSEGLAAVTELRVGELRVQPDRLQVLGELGAVTLEPRMMQALVALAEHDGETVSVQIQPSLWYNGAFVRSMGKGPFVRGYSPDGGDNTQAVFGEHGFFGLLKTGMHVGYKPSFSIRTSAATFTKFQQKFKTATGLRIGPFTLEAWGGSEKAGWTADESGRTFNGTTSSDQPMIIGVEIARLP